MLTLCPTRELAIQVANELSRICEGTDVQVCALYGGAALGPQISKLESGVHLVCGTPGRVLDHIRRRTMAVDEIGVLVLDECDEMLSMGFYEELSAIIDRLPAREQTLLFSATIPDDVQRLSHKYLADPVRLLLSEDYVGVKEITHAYYMVSGLARPRDLMRVLEVEAPESAIIFCNTREDTANVATYLRQHDLVAEAISSDFSQVERERAMQRMKDKKLQYLVATDVAARGIDIAELSHVINYKFPDNADIYIHRTGRTGRAGKSGIALSLVSPQELGDFYYMKLTHDIVPEERWLPTKTELAARQEGERLTALEANIRELDEELSPEFLSLAKRVWHSLRAEEIVAHLLQERFGKPMRKPLPRPAPRREQSGDTVERARDADRRPRRDDDRRPRRDDDRRPRRDTRTRPGGPGGPGGPRRGDDRGGRGRPRRDSGSYDREDRGVREPRDEIKLYLSAGRDDGVSPAAVIQFLTANGDIEGKDVNKIQIRDKFTFVGVNKAVSEGLVDRINGKNLGDKPVKVEHARS
jgi:ATP-dependent RNA helicase DeaD